MDRVEHYMTLVEGLFALRAVGEPLSQKTEAEIAEIHYTLWRQMTDDEQARLDGPDGLIEQVKQRWRNR